MPRKSPPAALHIYARLLEAPPTEPGGAPVQQLEYITVRDKKRQYSPPAPLMHQLPNLQDMLDDDAVQLTLIVPGEKVLLTFADVPVQQEKFLKEVVPVLLEEDVSEPIEQLHFAIGQRQAQSGNYPVAVIRKSLIKEWTSLWPGKEQKLRIIAEPHALPRPDQMSDWLVVLEAGRLILRYKQDEGWSMEEEAGLTLLSHHWQALNAPAQCFILSDRPEAETQARQVLAANAQLTAEYQQIEPQALLSRMVDTLESERAHAINLLAAAPESPTVSGMLSPLLCFKLTRMIVLVTLLHTLALTVSSAVFRQQAVSLETDAKSLYASLFPGERIVDLHSQLLAAHRGSTAGAESPTTKTPAARPLALLNDTAALLSKSGTRLSELTGDHSRLPATITALTRGNISPDTLRQQAQQQQLVLDIAPVESSKYRITVRGGNDYD